LRYNLVFKQTRNNTVIEKIRGYKFTVYPTVFNPKAFYSSEIFADFISELNELSGKCVLDMGCGSGIVSIFAASKGAKCLAADKNPMSVKAAAHNALQNNFSRSIEAVESDLFDRIGPRKFDIIFFNPPYFKGTPKNQFELALKGGENYEVIEQFIKDSREHLNENGIIYFIISSDIPTDLVENMFKSQGFGFEIVGQTEKFFETFYITKSF
jgi:release factor glutamine methyltransferase